MNEITIIELAPGQVGYYDDLSGIHLSLADKRAKVSKGVNTERLIKAVQAGKIKVVSGSLGSEAIFAEEVKIMIPTYERLLDRKKQQKARYQMLHYMLQPATTSEQEVQPTAPVDLESRIEETVPQLIEEEVKEVPQINETVTEDEGTNFKKKQVSRKKKELAEEE